MESTPSPAAATGSDRAADARRAVEANPVWYHSIELAPGVVTPGEVDVRPAAERILPKDMSGLRALDVGTFDGFWAFEMERRGAEVVAIDVETIDAAEWPPLNRPRLKATSDAFGVELGRGFRLASEHLGSSVRRVICPVYELSPDAIGGPVDFAFAGAIMLHLRDPVRALERVLDSLVPRGRLLQFEPFSIRLTLRSPRRPIARFEPLESHFNWWMPNLACLKGYAQAAGFVDVTAGQYQRPPSKRGQPYYAAVRGVRGPGPAPAA